MVKLVTLILVLGLAAPALANNEEVEEHEVSEIAQRANRTAQEKASRQKGEPESMLELLSGLKRPAGPTETARTVTPPTPDTAPAATGTKVGQGEGITTSSEEFDAVEPAPRSFDEAVAAERQRRSAAQPNVTEEPLPDESKARATEVAGSGSAGGSTEPHAGSPPTTSPAPQRKPIHPAVYVPAPTPATVAGRGGRYGTVVRQSEYGILFGRWVKARIEREVNSGDSGEIEIILEEDIDGKYRTIPAGTILYANKVFNVQTRRLAIQTRRGVTPDNQVIQQISATAYDSTRRAGLTGHIERNRDEVYRDAAGETLIDLASGAVEAVLPQELSGVASTVAKLESPQSRAIPYTIKVQPQSFWLRIDEAL